MNCSTFSSDQLRLGPTGQSGPEHRRSNSRPWHARQSWYDRMYSPYSAVGLLAGCFDGAVNTGAAGQQVGPNIIRPNR